MVPGAFEALEPLSTGTSSGSTGAAPFFTLGVEAAFSGCLPVSRIKICTDSVRNGSVQNRSVRNGS